MVQCLIRQEVVVEVEELWVLVVKKTRPFHNQDHRVNQHHQLPLRDLNNLRVNKLKKQNNQVLLKNINLLKSLKILRPSFRFFFFVTNE